MYSKLAGRLKFFLLNDINRLIFAMFVPIFIEQLIITMIGTVHTVMLSGVGTEAISAVGLVDQLNNFAFAVFTSISIGATVVVSQYMGQNRKVSAKATSEQAVIIGVLLSTVVGLLFVIFRDQAFGLFFGKTEESVRKLALVYLVASAASFPMISLTSTASGVIRGVGDPKTPMLISIIMGVSNVAIAATLILGMRMGVLGAGIALASSRTIGAAVAVTLMMRKRMIRSVKNLFVIRTLYIRQILKIGLYAGAENIIFQLGRTLVQGYVVLAGTPHIAANSIAGSSTSITAVPGNAMNVVATTLVGRFTGAGDREGAYKCLRNIVLLSCAMFGVVCLGVLPFADAIISLYTRDAEIAHLVKVVFVMNSIFVPIFWSPAFGFFSGMKGSGDARFTTIISVMSMWSCRVLFSYLLGAVLHWGVVGVWSGMFMDWMVRGIFATVRFKSRKWQKEALV